MQDRPILTLLVVLVACNKIVIAGPLLSLRFPQLKQLPPVLSSGSPSPPAQALQQFANPLRVFTAAFNPKPSLPHSQQATSITSPSQQATEPPKALGVLHGALASINPFNRDKQPTLQSVIATHTPSTLSSPSTASACGLALNGGKASAHAKSSAKSSSTAQAVSSAAAVANRASVSFAKATADSSGPGVTGTGLSSSAANAVSDKSSLAVANAGSRSVGLGSHYSESKITSNSAAVNNSISLIGGTVVSLSGLNGSAITSSTANGAASNNGVAATSADSISIGFKDSTAVGDATSSSQATSYGLAVSQSLMESFAIDNTTSTASSLATAAAKDASISAVRDKAATLGFSGSDVNSTTASQGASGVLGLGVIDSVARAITANKQHVCAEALTKAYSDVTTGNQVSLDTFLLALKQRAEAQCVSSVKDLIARAVAQQAAKGVGAGSHASDTASWQTMPTFDSVKAAVNGEVSDLLQAASDAVSHLGGS